LESSAAAGTYSRYYSTFIAPDFSVCVNVP
jgi:hypothetical protein